ncbi:cyclohexanone monooxygenase [Mycolicibacterium moriokaense]|uniref:Cyclohexanone monooxygenase n=2 Tax=Mycolicibacterium moriokaense TaxID=39691 RepID=A0AAD1HGD8_9MYCO|nr:cyclohexanone monooxygenase [Mycolicibacterium moriokaense]
MFADMRDVNNRADTVLDAVVIGAGFAGLYMLHRLRDHLGLQVRVFEAAGGVGGVWYYNRYPGARCDSDGFVYCYSFDRQLLQEWQWGGKYPAQPELLRYLEHVADRHDLRRDITFDTRVTAAEYDEQNARWTVTTDSGETVSTRFLITGIGHMSIARYVPDLPGLENFGGQWFHTGSWPHEPVDFSGKRVGVIGTGSSGVQCIPVVASQANHLTVFQRTPQYSIPARHETVDENFWREVKANYDEIWEHAKVSASGFPWKHNGKRAMEVSDEERQEIYENLWRQGGVRFANGSFRDLVTDEEANRTVSDFIREKIRQTVKDPALAEKLIPQHPFMSRRPIVDTDYFETYNRDDVTLVDVNETPIIELTASGVRTSDAEHPIDILILATGFDVVTGPYFGIDFRGRGGLRLNDAWREGPSGYLGLQTAGFPNLFTITGPGSTLGNLPLTIETHVEWISDCINHLRDNDIDEIEANPEAEKEWMRQVNEQAEKSMISRADSWINGANIPGKQRAYVFYWGHFGYFRNLCSDIAKKGYQGFILTTRRKPESDRSHHGEALLK